MDVCIKNIDEEDWRTFKSESVKHGLKMGDLFNKIVGEHKEYCPSSNRDAILLDEKPLKGILTREDGRRIRTEFEKNMMLRE